LHSRQEELRQGLDKKYAFTECISVFLKKGLECQTLEETPGEEAGLKHIN